MWKDADFRHIRDIELGYSLTSFFEFAADGLAFAVTNVYAPCKPPERDCFLDELHSLAPSCDLLWMIVGDFNLVRGPEDKNTASLDTTGVEAFNSFIDDLVLQELPLLDRMYTDVHMVE